MLMAMLMCNNTIHVDCGFDRPLHEFVQLDILLMGCFSGFAV